MKDHPVILDEQNMTPSFEAVEAHLVRARRLRSDELARLSGLLWRAPAAMAAKVHRLGAARRERDRTAAETRPGHA